MENISLKYYMTPLERVINVDKIVTIHYYEFTSNYMFKGEKHDFWEFLYVDKGEVEVMADTNGYKLTQGDIIFHRPNEFHSEWANGKTAPNLVIVSFECKDSAMDFFKDKIIKIDPSEKNLIAQIVKEGKEGFTNALGDHHKLEKRQNALFGTEQLIKLYLELLLINMLGYKSLHTFSRAFKEAINMSPSEYAASVKARANL